VKLAQKTAQGRRLVADVDAYLQGINAYFKSKGGFVKPFARNDVIAFGTLIGAVFGAGGGNEARSAQFLSALSSARYRQGPRRLERPARHMDARRRVSVAAPFPYANGPTGVGAGNVAIDAGSSRRRSPARRRCSTGA
jgi:hypothetical protein